MNKTFKLSLLAVVAIAVVACASGPQVNSLRGSSASTSDNHNLQVKDYVGKRPGQGELIARTFNNQPPLVPHTIENYEIGRDTNDCLDCHISDEFKGKKMPMVGKSHLVANADPKAEPQISMLRYQCNTCHVPQVDAQPLVDNVFQGYISKK